MDALLHAVIPTMAPPVAAALAGIGRTEDLHFAPDGRRLAIAGFSARTIVVVDVTIAEGPAVAVDGVTILTTDLGQPHGVGWTDPATLVVGDRDGGIALVPVPPAEGGVRTVEVASLPVPTGAGLLHGPGSVAVTGAGPEILVAGNWANAITRHRLGPGPTPAVVEEEVWLRRSLDLPDGVAVSADGRWVAVSNHNEHVVLVYDRTVAAGPDDREPAAVLRGAGYPHGLRFAADGHHLLVADAGAPVVLVFRAGPGGWRTAAYPVGAVRVLDDGAFAAGHRRPDEGGPKGIDVDPTGRVLALTTEQQPLGFVDLAAVLRDPPPIAPEDLAAYERTVLARIDTAKAARDRAAHDALAAEGREHDARALAARTQEHATAVAADAAHAHAAAEHAGHRAEAAERRAAEAEAHLAAIRATRLWRAADRPRRLYARLRARRRPS